MLRAALRAGQARVYGGRIGAALMRRASLVSATRRLSTASAPPTGRSLGPSARSAVTTIDRSKPFDKLCLRCRKGVHHMFDCTEKNIKPNGRLVFVMGAPMNVTPEQMERFVIRTVFRAEFDAAVAAEQAAQATAQAEADSKSSKANGGDASADSVAALARANEAARALGLKVAQALAPSKIADCTISTKRSPQMKALYPLVADAPAPPLVRLVMATEEDARRVLCDLHGVDVGTKRDGQPLRLAVYPHHVEFDHLNAAKKRTAA